jgi:hypothetical protein
MRNWIIEGAAGGAERFAKSALTIRASAIQYSPKRPDLFLFGAEFTHVWATRH